MGASGTESQTGSPTSQTLTVRAPISGGSGEVGADARNECSCATPLPSARHDGRRSHVDGGVAGQPVAVGDQQRGRHVRVVGEVVQVAVDHHGALRVAGEHHLGGRAPLGERLELIGGRVGAVFDAVHEAHPAAEPAVQRDGRRRVLHGLGGDGLPARGQLACNCWNDW